MGSKLSDMIRRNALWYRDRPAFDCGDRGVTHGEFHDISRKLASALTENGIKHQDRVAILSMNSVEYCIVYGACELGGYIAATVNFRLAPPEVLQIVQDSSPAIMFVESGYIDLIDSIRTKLTSIKQFVTIDCDPPEWAIGWDEFLETAGDQPLNDPSEDDICYLIYTSGTTGKSKGTMLGHHAEATMAGTIALAMGISSNDKTLLMMPLFHIGAKAIALGQQWVGGSVILHRMFDPIETLAEIDRQNITATHMAPTLVQAMLEVEEFEEYDISSLRTLIYSAAAMPPPLLQKALDRFGPIFMQMYGQTEGIATILPVSAHQLDDDPETQSRLLSVGHPFIGMEISIRDDSNNILPTYAVGEICLRGDMVMTGYWNNMAATLETLGGGWLHTGDIGKLDEDGYVHLVDRKKDVIISGGENIYSREVEDAIQLHPAVHQVAVIARPHEKWGEAVCAVVTLREGETLTEDALVIHCLEQIARYKRPRSVIFVDELPVLATGKINKRSLREQILEVE